MAAKACVVVLVLLAAGLSARADEDPLPSWNEGPAKAAIVDFVTRVTTKFGNDWVPEDQRIAVFDNDGTLWPENPLPFELAFAIDRVKAKAGEHPEWKEKQPYKAVIEGDLPGLIAQGRPALVELILATHTGMTTDAFAGEVGQWIREAKHPRYGKRYSELTYQPMQELLRLLRSKGFKTYIVSGGGADFMRVWSEDVYGIPPEQVVGSVFQVQYRENDGEPELVIQSELALIDDKAGKPVAIHHLIGQRPIAAFGNSEGDYEMLRYVTAGGGKRLGLIVHHTDGEREYAYDANPKSSGKLVRGLEEAAPRKWVVVDMARDWGQVFGFEGK